MTPMETIGYRVKKARLERGISQKELAASVGIAPGTLADLESGRSKGTTVLHRIAEKLGMDASAFDPTKPRRAAIVNRGSPQVIENSEVVHSANSRVLRLDPAMIRDGHRVIENFFESLGGSYKVDIDPDLLARGYEWAQTQNPATLQAIYVDIEARLSERGVKHGEQAQVGRRRKRGSA